MLLFWGTTGFCGDCGGERHLLPVDESGVEFCCTDCDGVVLLLAGSFWPHGSDQRRAG